MRPSAFVAALALLALPAHAGVIVVDKHMAPGADVPQISQAIGIASPGDTILVRPAGVGTYDPFDVSIGVTIVADKEFEVALGATVRVHDLPDGQTVTLRGILFYPGSALGSHLLVLEDCAGTVVVDRCRLDPLTAAAAEPALRVENCSGAVFSHCEVFGAAGLFIFDDDKQFATSPGSDAMVVRGESLVALLDCSVRGGFGGWDSEATPATGQRGGDALTISGGTVFASGTQIAGGDGGWDLFTSSPTAKGGNGGDGVVVNGPATIQLHDSTATAGAGGAAGPNGTPGLPGLATSVCCGGVVETVAGEARDTFASEGSVSEGATISLALEGAPGEAALVLISLSADALPASAFDGVLVALPIQREILLPSIGPTGQITLQGTVPDLGPLESLNLVVQTLFGPTNPTLSSVAAVTLLDAQF